MFEATEGAAFHTLIDLLRERAARHPDRVAYTFLDDGETESQVLTFGQLEQRVRAVAARLQELDLADQRALLLYPPGLDFIVAFLACAYARVVAVPAYPPQGNQNSPRLLAVIKDAGARCVLTTAPLLSTMEAQLQALPEMKALRSLATDSVPVEHHSAWREPEVNGDTLAFLQYTSGSTGTPKGVMVTHGNVLHNERAIERAFGHSSRTIFVGWLPLFHDMGLIGNVLQPLYLGVRSILMSPVAFIQKPARWVQAISKYRATTSGGPNFGYDLCARKVTAEQREGLDLSSWQVAFNGAEPIRPNTLQRFLEAFKDHGLRASTIYPCYGMAESTLLVTGNRAGHVPVTRDIETAALEQGRVVEVSGPAGSGTQTLVSSGRSWVEKVRIVDPAALTACPEDRVGEIWISSASIARGYWNQPELTRGAFHARIAGTDEGPFLRTGDLGFMRGEELFVTGRIKDVIIIRGRNHYPQDIEQTVEESHPALRAGCGAAFSVEVEDQERLVIVQEVERSYLRNLDVEDVVGSIRQAVSAQHELHVHAVMLLNPSSIPKTSSGKIQRHASRKGFLGKSLSCVGEWVEQFQPETPPPSGPTPGPQATYKEEEIQAWLLGRLSQYLSIGVEEIDTTEPFTHYGLDSAVAVSLTGELAGWLGREFEPTLFWEHPRADVLIAHIVNEMNTERPGHGRVPHGGA